MTTGDKIARARKEMGLSQEELANRSGISIRTIQRIEKSMVQPHGHTLKKIASTLEMDLSALTNYDVQKNDSVIRKLRVLNSIGLLVIIAPLIHLFLQIAYLSKHREIKAFNEAGRKLISFQMLWLLAVLLILSLIHVGSLLITGQNVIGHYPVRMTAYLTLLLINVTLTLTNSIKLGQKDFNFFRKVPNLI